MPNLDVNNKVIRVVKFIAGLKDPRIAARLSHHGFKRKVLQRGIQLMNAAVAPDLNAFPELPPAAPALLDKIDSWENKWFPIINVSLKHNYPEVHAKVMRNLKQTRGPELLLSVPRLVNRIRVLESGPPNDNRDEAARKRDADARKLLTERGVDDEELQRVEALLEEAGMVSVPDPEDAPVDDEEQGEDPAVTAMWGWYLEWSTIARTAITNGNMLRKLGFRTRSGSQSEDGPTEPEQEGDDDGGSVEPAGDEDEDDDEPDQQ